MISVTTGGLSLGLVNDIVPQRLHLCPHLHQGHLLHLLLFLLAQLGTMICNFSRGASVPIMSWKVQSREPLLIASSLSSSVVQRMVQMIEGFVLNLQQKCSWWELMNSHTCQHHSVCVCVWVIVLTLLRKPCKRRKRHFYLKCYSILMEFTVWINSFQH